MKPTLTILIAMLLAPLAALHAAETTPSDPSTAKWEISPVPGSVGGTR